MISDRANEIENVINNLNNYFAGDRASNFSDLVAQFDEVVSKPANISYLKNHPDTVHAIREVQTKIVDVFVNSFTNMTNEAFKKINLDMLSEKNIEQLTGGLTRVYNAVSDYIKHTLLLTDNKEQRDSLMERYLLIGKKLMDVGNYAIAESMFMAFNLTEVGRLFTINDEISGLSNQAIDIYAKMKSLFELGNKDALFTEIEEQAGSKLPPIAVFTRSFEGLSGTLNTITNRKEPLEQTLEIFNKLGNANDADFEERSQQLAHTFTKIIMENQNNLKNVDGSKKEQLENQITEVQKNLADLSKVMQQRTPAEKNATLNEIKLDLQQKIDNENQNIKDNIAKTVSFTKGAFKKYYKPYDENNINQSLISEDLADDLFNREDILLINQTNFLVGKLSAKLSALESKISFLSAETSKESIAKLQNDFIQFVEDLNDQLKKDSHSDHGLLDGYVDYLQTKRNNSITIEEFTKTKNELKSFLNVFIQMQNAVNTNLYDLSKHYRFDQKADIRKSRLLKKAPKVFAPLDTSETKSSVTKTISKPLKQLRRKTFSGVSRMKTKMRKEPEDISLASENEINKYIEELNNRGDKVSTDKSQALSDVFNKTQSYQSNVEKMKYLDKLLDDLKKIRKGEELNIRDETEKKKYLDEISPLQEHHAASTKLRSKETSAIKLLKKYSNELASSVLSEITNHSAKTIALTDKLNNLFIEKNAEPIKQVAPVKSPNTKPVSADKHEIVIPVDSPIKPDVSEVDIAIPQDTKEARGTHKPLPPTPGPRKTAKPLPAITEEIIHKQIESHKKELAEFKDRLQDSIYQDTQAPLREIIASLQNIYQDLLNAKTSGEVELLENRLKTLKELYRDTYDITMTVPEIDHHLSSMVRLVDHKAKALSSRTSESTHVNLLHHQKMIMHFKNNLGNGLDHEARGDYAAKLIAVYTELLENPSDEKIQKLANQFHAIKQSYLSHSLARHDALTAYMENLENDFATLQGSHLRSQGAMLFKSGNRLNERNKLQQKKNLRDQVRNKVGGAVQELGKNIKKFGNHLIDKIKNKL